MWYEVEEIQISDKNNYQRVHNLLVYDQYNHRTMAIIEINVILQ